MLYAINLILALGYVFYATYAATDVWNLVLFPITGFETNYLQALGIVAFIGIVKRSSIIKRAPEEDFGAIAAGYVMVTFFWLLAHIVT